VSDNPHGKPDYCRSCTLFEEPGIVRGDGNRNAKIFYLGEAPGAEEVDFPKFRQDRMRPFVGGSGRIRDKMLSHAGLDKRLHLYTTNVVKCRPPGNRLPTPLEVACCTKYLVEELEAVNPNVIIAAGELALTAVTGKTKIGLYRGVPTDGPERFGSAAITSANGEATKWKVFPTWHPAFIMRSQWNWPFAVHDLARAKVESAYPEIRRIPIHIERLASPEVHGADLLRAARERGAATFDFETSGLSFDESQILMCGFVGRPDKADVYTWTPGAQQLFQEILDDPAIQVIGQNILNFDLPFAEAKGFRVTYGKVFDTMVAFHLTNASYGQTTVAEQKAGTFRVTGAEKDLAFIASNHTDIEYWKSRDGYKNDLRGVCGLDCIATDRSATHPRTGLQAELKMYDMEDLYWKHVLPVHPILKRMTRRGVKIDQDRAARWLVLMNREADRLEEEFRTLVGDPLLNLASPQQLMKLFYETWKLPVQYVDDKKKGKRPTANAEAIDALAHMFPQHVGIRSIAEIRHLRKMSSTYVEPGLYSPDGRLHPKFGVSKAATGRFNSWDPNAQNVPEGMRDIWIPDSPDHVLISADWSQIEWRLAMVMSGDPVGLELLAAGVDNHRAVAAQTLRKLIEDVTEEERYASKFIVYGLGYGRGADSIAQGHGLAFDFVQSFIRDFFTRFRVFRDWRESNVNFVKANHYLKNPYNRRRWWYTWQVTEVYNFPQQSTAADMMYDALIEVDRDLPKDAHLILTVHDELVVHAAKDVVRESMEVIRTHMERLQPKIQEASARADVVDAFYPGGWFCPADIHIGSDWMMTKSKDAEKKAQRAELAKTLGVSA
jgi:uracil-DNA glycosylase family 4